MSTERCECCLAAGVRKGPMVLVLLSHGHSSRAEGRVARNQLSASGGSAWASLNILPLDGSAGTKRIRTPTREAASGRSGPCVMRLTFHRVDRAD